MFKSAIVFVHGLGGDSVSTWGTFPELIRADVALKDYDIDSFSFPTSLFRVPLFSKKYPKIQTLADALRTLIDTKYRDSSNLILVCHSLGGLIARRYLVDEVKRKAELRVRGLLLYAVPNDGAGLANVTSHVSFRHNQLLQLCKDSDLIRDLNADWETNGLAERIKVRYVVAGLDRVVTEESARSSWGANNVDVLADRGHIDLVKPKGPQDLTYLILKTFAISFIDQSSEPITDAVQKYATSASVLRSVKSSSGKGYRVVGFDLDGTLLRGIDFSWTVVWKYLAFPEAVYKGAMRDYRKGKTTYQEWCDIACIQFRAKGLRRADFPTIVKDITVTKNLRETLKILRSSGIVLALISGGIDTFIEEKIPDAAELFDYICVNRLRFDQPSGLISGANATPFDFEGKTLALNAICTRQGCSLKEAVFVGEGFNDEDVVNKVGLSIAYPPGEMAIDAASISVMDDDLSKILDHIL